MNMPQYTQICYKSQTLGSSSNKFLTSSAKVSCTVETLGTLLSSQL